MSRSPRVAQPSRILTRDECEALGRRTLGLVSAGEAQMRIESRATAATAFARGDAHLVSENATAEVSLMLRLPDGKSCSATTNRLDQSGIKTLVAEAEAAARTQPSAIEGEAVLGPQQYQPSPKLFFDTTDSAMAPEARGAVLQAALDATASAGLVGAGDLTFELHSRAHMSTAGLFAYTCGTYGELSVSGRTKSSLGSGWGWAGSEDWSRVTTGTVIARAVDLAQRSANPVAVEPGRYTVILEPGAVAALVEPILSWWAAFWADSGVSVFANEPAGTNKIGLQMMDARLSLVSDPWDLEKPTSPVGRYGEPLTKVGWFERGILKHLEYDASYAQQKKRPIVLDPGGARLHAEGAAASLEEMIATTERGIWVNRLSGVFPMNFRTLLLTGTTRDGTFLIEGGKITKAIKNLRFTESPFFVLNKLDAFGEPIRASRTVVAPRLKVRDFDFTSLTDAV